MKFITFLDGSVKVDIPFDYVTILVSHDVLNSSYIHVLFHNELI